MIKLKEIRKSGKATSIVNILTGTVSSIAFGGQGVVRHEGKVIFVPFVLPKEVIEFEVKESKKSHGFGKLIKILEESPQRITPKCEYYGHCGGCQLQHVDYNQQLAFKQQFVEDALARIGRLHCEVQPIIGAEQQWAYRRRIKLHQRGEQFGFIGVDGHSFVPITHCEIYAGSGCHPGLDPGSSASDLAPGSWAGVTDDIFIQAHPESEHLYQDIYNMLQLTNTKKILDLYCGVGILTARLANLGAQVTGVELNPKAIAWAQVNHSEPVQWVVGDVAQVLERYLRELKPDWVLANPPRTGLHPKAIAAFVQHQPANLVYTSCMPATLARDLKLLTEAGYRIEKCQPYDLFPQTTHVETVVTLCTR